MTYDPPLTHAWTMSPTRKPRSLAAITTILLGVALGGCLETAAAEVPEEADRFAGLLTQADPFFRGAIPIVHDQETLEVVMDLRQPVGGTLGPFLVYVSIIDPSGQARVDDYEKGGMYMVPVDSVSQTFMVADIDAGTWALELRLWDRSVPVQFDVEWTASTAGG